MFRIRSFVVLALCAVMLITTVSVAAPVTAQVFGSDEITGVSVDVGPEETADIREQAKEIPGVDLKENTVIAYSDNEETVVITTDEPVATGSIEASGELYGNNIPRRGNAKIDAVMVADSVEVTKEPDSTVTIDTLQNNPESVENKLVKVTTEYRQLTANSDTLDGEVVSMYRTGSLTPVSTPLLGEGAIGDSARSFTREIAETDNLREATGSIGSQTRAIGLSGQNDYWMDAEATITLVVVNEGPQHTFFISDVTVEGTETTLEDIQAGEHSSGDIVTVESSLASTRISVKESLVATSDCSPDTFFVPNVGCIPAVADTVVEGGLLYDENNRLLTAGISNRVQTRPVEFNHNEVIVTGEVVEAENLDPGADRKYGLLIYEVEQRGSPDSEDVPSEIIDERDSLTNRFEQQLRTTAEESEAIQQEQPGTDRSTNNQEDQQATDQGTNSEASQSNTDGSGSTQSSDQDTDSQTSQRNTDESGATRSTDQDASTQTSPTDTDDSDSISSLPSASLVMIGGIGALGGIVTAILGTVLFGVVAIGRVINTQIMDFSFKQAFLLIILGLLISIVSTVVIVGTPVIL